MDLAERKLAAAQRLRDAVSRREQIQAGRTEADEVNRMERDANDAEAILDAEEKHGLGKFAVVETEMLGCVIVKTPHPNIYRRFRDKGDAKTADLERLVRACLVYPDGNAFDQMLSEAPGTLDRVADRCIHLAGFRQKETSGK